MPEHGTGAELRQPLGYNHGGRVGVEPGPHALYEACSLSLSGSRPCLVATSPHRHTPCLNGTSGEVSLGLALVTVSVMS